MTIKHTPGPWHLAESALMPGRFLDVVTLRHARPDKEDEPHQWTVAGVNTRRVEAEANARLIAAAPDLLVALEGCADALKEAGKSFALNNPLASRPNLFELHESVARAAISKARGE